jgi:hypothetical protein
MVINSTTRARHDAADETNEVGWREIIACSALDRA